MKISDEYRRLRGGKLYHSTHRDNIPLIRHYNKIFTSHNLIKHGIKHKSMTDSSSKSIDRRKNFDKCVFLTFSTSHPLIYKKREFEGLPIDEVVIDISILDIQGVKIADRVATDNNVIMYTPEEALNQLKILHCHDGNVGCRETWLNVRKYEILIPCDIDLTKY